VRINTLGQQLGQDQFVDEERRGMAQIENEWMPQRNGFLKITGIIGQAVEQACVGVKRVREIAGYFVAFLFRIAPAQVGRPFQ
jgi:hypothetical protein